jgi:hypothetical protein
MWKNLNKLLLSKKEEIIFPQGNIKCALTIAENFNVKCIQDIVYNIKINSDTDFEQDDFQDNQNKFSSSGRFSRHTEISSIINRPLTTSHVNSTLEPNGLSRDDGKCPDGMTLVPWIKGEPLVWDVTIVLSPAKNSGRQCHFKIWLDCHKFKIFPCLIMPTSTKCQKIK